MAVYDEKAFFSDHDLESDAGSSSHGGCADLESSRFSSSSTLTTRTSSPSRSEILGPSSQDSRSSSLPRFSIPSIPWPSYHLHSRRGHGHGHGHLLSGVLSILSKIGIFLLPSFLQPGYHAPNRLSPTAYLDGMRGLAALFVFFCHYFYTCYVIATGYGLDDSNYHLLKLPFVRLFYSGPPMVCVFFVVSGYALSLKPLKQIRSRRFGDLSATMSSFIFRRGLRLFAPAAASTLVIVLLSRAGWYAANVDFAADGTFLRNVQETHYQGPEELGEQLREWAWDLFRFVHVWDWASFGGSTSMDVHLWTIPVEFRSSMVLFLSLVGLARVTAAKRGMVLGGLMAFCYRSARWEMVLFYAGMGLAEWDLARGAHNSFSPLGGEGKEETGLLPVKSHGPKQQHHQQETRRARMAGWFWTGVGVLGLYLMSQPDQGSEDTPGWLFLTDLIPLWWNYDELYRYWQSVGAVLFVAAVGRSRGWQKFFESPVVQYFGRISYGLYLMHGPVLHTLGYSVDKFVWTRVTGIETETAYTTGFGLGALIIVPAVIWVSDVFWRGVDAPVVRFAKWFEGKCSIAE